MKKLFKSRKGSRYSNDDAQVIGKSLTKVNKDFGKIEPLTIVTEAEKITHPLHNYFEWSNKKAGHEHRLQQARTMIRSVEIVIIEKDSHIETEAFHHVEISESEKAYVSYEDVMENEDYYQQILQKALGEVRNWKERYEAYKELKAIHKAIEKVTKGHEK